MGKLFGTDGVRGRANEYPITPEMSLRMGKAIASVFGDIKGKKSRVIIGKDTRLSGYMLETALTSGLISMGMDVYLVGPMPTPAVALLTRSMISSAGIMITASHNPAEDNGIKIFGSDGFKLTDAIENKIEKLILSDKPINPDPKSSVGKAYRVDDVGGRYIEYAKNSVDHMDLSGLRIVLDCANGAAYHLTPILMKELGCEVIKEFVEPDGLNINHQCGATYAERLADSVNKYRADCGIALDGDADRVIFTDHEGTVVDGDRIIAICALAMKEAGTLTGNAIAVTSMSNMGLLKLMEANGIKAVVTDVGDRHVIAAMRKGNIKLGGEQSGHIIFGDYSTTGDGTVAALRVLQLIKQTGKNLKELASVMDIFPQQLVNVMVKKKPALNTLPGLTGLIAECEKDLGDSGRCILRYSGTEKKLRILVEAQAQKDVDKWVKKFVATAEEELCS
ncbi:phosphoglucosamine mutase [Lentisphaera profundi]|uniref:Phosphoglucosamine mutase n=1 Tax=Lentisphaera profundi TaxID=1658616 RepID=A0ABY7VU15_9BACT|nr:phosphoglucosamine mutase [Lentisphaera profundi]WDE96387.1 phosphoglucosamine mutase [Lentisphaera profundi]